MGNILSSDALFTTALEQYKTGEISDKCLIDKMMSYHQLQLKKEKLFNSLRQGQSLNDLLKIVYKFINNPITVVDSSYSILASYPKVVDERNLEIKNNRLTIKNVFSQNMKDNKITEKIYHSIYPFTVKVEDFPYDWTFESVRINQAVVGYLCVRGINKDFSDEDLEIIHELSRIISIALQKDSSFSNPKGIKHNHFFRELFLNHYDSEESIKNQLSLFGIKPDMYYYLIACDFIDSKDKILSPEYYCQQLVSILPNSITGIYNGIIITLVPTHFIRPYSDDNRDKLITFLEMNNMIATVSFIFTELMDSSTYFEQCQSMLSMIDSSTSCGSILLYGEYCFRHITSIIDDPSIIISSIHPAMKFMKKYDEENSTEYLVTLETFLQKNRSAPAAAEALHIHKSTFFYRIEKMKSLFDIDINDADKMFAYEISLKIMNVCHLR